MQKTGTYPDYHYRASVLSVETQDRTCPACGERGLVFVVHGFKIWPEEKRIQERCKACTIREAGGEDYVWVKTLGKGLRPTWNSGRRQTQLTAAAAAAKATRKSPSGSSE